MGKCSNIQGQKFGRLTVIERVNNPTASREKTKWKCLCDCGNIVFTITTKLKNGHTNSCGCFKHEELLKNQKERGLKRRKGIKTPYHQAFNDYKRNARKDKRELLLTESDFIGLFSKPCFYCGNIDERIYRYTGETFKINGVDRIDSSKGYTIENTVSCCRKCNVAKHDYSNEQFLNWIKAVYKHSIEEQHGI